MPPSTPLFRQRAHNADGPALFLRATRPPWSDIPQQTLAAVRGLLALYLALTLATTVAWQARVQAVPALVPFQFEVVGFAWQTGYAWAALVSLTDPEGQGDA